MHIKSPTVRSGRYSQNELRAFSFFKFVGGERTCSRVEIAVCLFQKAIRDKKQEEATEKLKRQLPPARTKSTIQSNTLSFCLRRQSPRSGKVRSKGDERPKWKVESGKWKEGERRHNE